MIININSRYRFYLYVVIISVVAVIYYLNGFILPYGDFQFFNEPAINYANTLKPYSHGVSYLHPGVEENFSIYTPGYFLLAYPFYKFFSIYDGFQVLSITIMLIGFVSASLLLKVIFSIKDVNLNHPFLYLLSLMALFTLPGSQHPATSAVSLSLLGIYFVLKSVEARGRYLQYVGAGVISFSIFVSPLPGIVGLFFLLSFYRLFSKYDIAGMVFVGVVFSAMNLVVWIWHFNLDIVEFESQVLRHLGFDKNVYDTPQLYELYSVKKDFLNNIGDKFKALAYFVPLLVIFIVGKVLKGRDEYFNVVLFVLFFLLISLVSHIHVGYMSYFYIYFAMISIYYVESVDFMEGYRKLIFTTFMLMSIVAVSYPGLKKLHSDFYFDHGDNIEIASYIIDEKIKSNSGLRDGVVMVSSVYFPMFRERNIAVGNWDYLKSFISDIKPDYIVLSVSEYRDTVNLYENYDVLNEVLLDRVRMLNIKYLTTTSYPYNTNVVVLKRI